MSSFVARAALVFRCGLLCVLAVAVGLQPAMVSAQPSARIQQLLEPLDRARAALAGLRGDLDPALLDVDGVLRQTGTEAEEIAAFVVNDVAFAPYLGSMLGSGGVVATRRGNALDQSVLLATLLNRSGYEARIVGAALPDDKAERLYAHWLSNRPAELLPYRHGTASAQSMVGAGAALSEQIKETNANIARVEAARERGYGYALSAAAAAGVDLSPRDTRAALLKTVSDYHWVQYRDAPFSDWVDLHPAFGAEGIGDGESPEPVAYFTGVLPDALTHRITMQGHIDRLLGDKVVRAPITSAWTTAVSTLEGRPLTFTIVPLDPPEGEDMEGAKVFAPFINSHRAPGASMFDLKGNAVDMSLLDMGAPGSMVDLIMTFGEKGAAAANLLAAVDFGAEETAVPDGQESSELLRVVVTVTTEGPTGRKTHERVLFNREQADGSILPRSQFSLAESLYRHFAFIADAGFAAPSRQLRSMFDDLDRRLAVTQFDILNWNRPAGVALWKDRAAVAGDDFATPGMLGTAFSSLGNPDLSFPRDEVLAAPNGPSIVAISTSPVQTGGQLSIRTVVDIVSIDWSIWNRPDDLAGALMLAPARLAGFGAAATLAEAELVQESAELLSEGFARGASAWATLDRPELALERTNEARNAAMAADLARGNRVVLASAAAEVADAWWSVDPRTGLVIGMNENGGAGELTEYVSTLISVSMSLVFTYTGVQGCNDPSMSQEMVDCCTLATVASGVIIGGFVGFGIGALISRAMASATGAVAAGVQIVASAQLDLVANLGTSTIPGDFGLCSLAYQ